MKTSNTRVGKLNSAMGKIMMALVFASMIGGLSMAPAFGDNGRRGYRGQGGYYAQGYDRRGYYPPPRHYYYAEPVYAPPPIVYYPTPYQSPGINLVFPIHIR